MACEHNAPEILMIAEGSRRPPAMAEVVVVAPVKDFHVIGRPRNRTGVTGDWRTAHIAAYTKSRRGAPGNMPKMVILPAIEHRHDIWRSGGDGWSTSEVSAQPLLRAP